MAATDRRLDDAFQLRERWTTPTPLDGAVALDGAGNLGGEELRGSVIPHLLVLLCVVVLSYRVRGIGEEGPVMILPLYFFNLSLLPGLYLLFL